MLSIPRPHDNARKNLLGGIKADCTYSFIHVTWIFTYLLGVEMGPYYKFVTPAPSILSLDKTLLAEMEAANEEELKKLDEPLAEAQKIDGESEILDALKGRVNYLTGIGDKVHFRFLNDFARLHGINVGTIFTSSKARTREGTWAQLMNRHHTDYRPSRVLLHRDRNNQHEKYVVLLSFLSFWPIHLFTD